MHRGVGRHTCVFARALDNAPRRPALGTTSLAPIIMRLRSSIAAAAAALGMPVALAAQPACVAGTLESYFGLGGAGCTIGAATVRQFGPGFVNSYVGQVTLTPYARDEGQGQVVGFTVGYAGPITVAQTFDGTVPSFFRQFAQTFEFNIDAGPALRVGGVRLEALFATVSRSGSGSDPFIAAGANAAVGVAGADASARLTDDCQADLVCATSGAANVPGNRLPQQVDRVRMLAGVGISASPTTVAGPVTYTASVSGVRAGVFIAPVAVLVPEPATFALAAVGGLALAGAGARRRRRRDAR